MNNRYTIHTVGTICAAFFAYFGGHTSAINVFTGCTFYGAQLSNSGQMTQPDRNRGSYHALLEAMVSQGCLVTIEAMERHVTQQPMAGNELQSYLPRIGFRSGYLLFSPEWWNEFKTFAGSLDGICVLRKIRTVPELDALLASLRSEQPVVMSHKGGEFTIAGDDSADSAESNEVATLYCELGGEPWELESVKTEGVNQHSGKDTASQAPISVQTPHSAISLLPSILSPSPQPPSPSSPPPTSLSLPQPPSSVPPPPFPCVYTHRSPSLPPFSASPSTPASVRTAFRTPSALPLPRKVETLLSSLPRSPRGTRHDNITHLPFGRVVNFILLACKVHQDIDVFVRDGTGEDMQVVCLSYLSKEGYAATIDDLGLLHKSFGHEWRRKVRTALLTCFNLEEGYVRIHLADGRVIDPSDETEYEVLYRSKVVSQPVSGATAKQYAIAPYHKQAASTRSKSTRRSRSRTTRTRSSGGTSTSSSKRSRREGPSREDLELVRRRLSFEGPDFSKPPRYSDSVLLKPNAPRPPESVD